MDMDLQSLLYNPSSMIVHNSWCLEIIQALLSRSSWNPGGILLKCQIKLWIIDSHRLPTPTSCPPSYQQLLQKGHSNKNTYQSLDTLASRLANLQSLEHAEQCRNQKDSHKERNLLRHCAFSELKKKGISDFWQQQIHIREYRAVIHDRCVTTNI